MVEAENGGDSRRIRFAVRRLIRLVNFRYPFQRRRVWTFATRPMRSSDGAKKKKNRPNRGRKEFTKTICDAKECVKIMLIRTAMFAYKAEA